MHITDRNPTQIINSNNINVGIELVLPSPSNVLNANMIVNIEQAASDRLARGGINLYHTTT